VAADADKLADEAEISRGLIRTWQHMSELMAVKGIGPQYAEVLVRAGVDGVDDLKKHSAASVAKMVDVYLAGVEQSPLKVGVTPVRVQRWKEAAKGMRKSRI